MSPRLAAIVPVADEGERSRLPALLEALVAQSDVSLDVIVVDATPSQDAPPAPPGVTWLRDPSPSRGRAYRRALASTAAEWIAWADPACLPAPGRLARQLAGAVSRAGVRLVTSDLRCPATASAAERHVSLDLHGTRPPGAWHAAVLVHRDALAGIDERCFAPAELALYRAALAAGAVVHVPEPLGDVVDADAWTAADARAREDADLLDLWGASPDLPADRGPEITVLLACHERMDVLPACLAGFARQRVLPGTLELVVCDDGSRDGTLAFLESLELPVPLRFTTGPNAGAAAARNRGLHLVRGRQVLFVNDDTVPAPDLVLRHLEAHRQLAGRRAAVLGTFEQPSEPMERALTRVFERSEQVFAYAGLAPGAEVGGELFYTCNVSVPAKAVRAVGRFDEDFPWYTEDTEYGCRLERAGYRVHYRPEARAWHHHPPTFEALRRRQRAVAAAHVRLFRKHPDRLPSPVARLTARSIREQHRLPRRHLEDFERAAASLARTNVARLERLGGAASETAERIEERLAELVGRINTLWWFQGIEHGLALEGLDGFPGLLNDRDPMPDVAPDPDLPEAVHA